jgi:hypothetical protein
MSEVLTGDLHSDGDPIWLSGANNKQALLLSREDSSGQSFRYLPVSDLRQDRDGKITFQIRDWADGFPLKIYEDENFALPRSDRRAWLGQWHAEQEWLGAVHKTIYSLAIIALNEQMDRHPLFTDDDKDLASDERLIRRFRQRQRHLAEADLLILANDHWNFDVRGFNPGGNHGSFFRVSANATLMIAGGNKTGIARGLTVEEPYDGLSFVPTILALMGKIDSSNNPSPELYERGFRRFPGRVIKEIVGDHRK